MQATIRTRELSVDLASQNNVLLVGRVRLDRMDNQPAITMKSLEHKKDGPSYLKSLYEPAQDNGNWAIDEHEVGLPPVVNIMNVQNMTYSQIQGSPGATQHIDLAHNDLAAIHEVLAEFETALRSVTVEGDLQREAQAEVATIQAQLSSPKPKRLIIVEGIKSICSVLETVASSTIAKQWLPKLLPLLARLG
jgi:hypothetical protein